MLGAPRQPLMPNQTQGLINHTQKHNIHAPRLVKNKYFFHIHFPPEQTKQASGKPATALATRMR
ncbi:hypothetical protein [Janthinobacterium sp. AD80]|uniref:hypothetical protein n=1 Tax=Janthinobacterium sp. AD80 TaxID=1528773 RepID=UPI0011AF9943|nr:hypothetical protein [Janthinobacterium sp. AD80]